MSPEDAHQSYWSGRKVLVTGAAGFLGQWTVQRLVDLEADPIGVDLDWTRASKMFRQATRSIPGDVRSRELLDQLIRERHVDTVIHLAAQSLVGPAIEDPSLSWDHNIRGTWTVLETCRRFPDVKQIVTASSDKVYGDAGGRPYTETDPLLALNPYDASKACGDLIAQSYGHTFGVPVAITRCGNLFGGGDLNWSRIVPGTIRSILEGTRPIIRSDGTFVRDYLYVEDAVEAVLYLARQVGQSPSLAGQAFNFAAGAQLTVVEIVERILKLMDSDLEPDVLSEARFEIPEQRLDHGKATRELGWTPTWSLEDGLEQAIDWYRKYLGSR